ncbi:hypothetical protein LXL04_004723 [Taraxacum kok-saghyz]
MEKSSTAKWEGKVTSSLTKASADQIWPLFIDFFNLHKWFPGMSACNGIHGVNGEVGCIRHCVGFPFKNSVGKDCWAKARLVAVDPNEMSLSYDIIESNFGFNSYVSTVKVIGSGAEGCVVEWSFTIDPVEWTTYEYMVGMYQDILDKMTNKMEVGLVEKKAL